MRDLIPLQFPINESKYVPPEHAQIPLFKSKSEEQVVQAVPFSHVWQPV